MSISSCPAFTTTSGNEVLCGPIEACPGDEIVLQTCGACTGNTKLNLYNSDESMVDSGDDGCGDSTNCSFLSYIVPSEVDCQVYQVGETCFEDGCSGSTAIQIVKQFPTVDPTPSPSNPSALPTEGPTPSGPYCPAFSTTVGSFVNCGPFTACPGDTIELSNCDSCTGDTKLYLYDAAGYTVDIGGYNCPRGGGCSSLSYIVPAGACEEYKIGETCYSGSCTGTTSIELIPPVPSADPTFRPSSPSAEPTRAPTSATAYCPAFSTTSGNIVQCGPFNACPGQTIVLSTCNACTEDTMLYLFNAGGSAVGYGGDDGCGGSSLCSYLTYTVPEYVECQDYQIGETCFSGSCTGTTSYDLSVLAPTPVPTPVPTNPTALPTASPTEFTCPAFSTASETPAVTCGPVRACPGETIQLSTCDTCIGDTVLGLTNAAGASVATGDQGCVDSSCSLLSYVVPPDVACQDYEVQESCYENSGACSATTDVQVMDPPTLCPPFSTTPGWGATCPIHACEGDTIVLSNCDACTGDTILDLYSTGGYLVAYGDDGCGGSSRCTKMTYLVPSGEGCQDYLISQSCFSNSGPCSGTTSFLPAAAVQPTFEPTALLPISVPTTMPTTATPVIRPTVAPTFHIPTAAPSFKPSMKPTMKPSLKPTSPPIAQSTVKPTVAPTAPTVVPTPTPSALPSTIKPTAVPTALPSADPTTTPTALPSADPTAAPSAEPSTASPSTGIEAYVAIYNTSDYLCTQAVDQVLVVDSGACTVVPGPNYATLTMKVECASNAPNAAWTAGVYYSDATCSGTPVNSLSGTGVCGECDFASYMNRAVEINCGGTSCNPPTVGTGYMSYYGSDSCTGESYGAAVPLNQCIALTNHGPFGKFSCDSLTSGSGWTLELYENYQCQAGTATHYDACDCVPMDSAGFDDYTNGFSLAFNCGSSLVASSCSYTAASSNSASGMSTGEMGGIVGGVVGGVLVLALVGLWAAGMIGFGATAASSSAAAATAAATAPGAASASGAQTVGADIEMSVNPMAPPVA